MILVLAMISWITPKAKATQSKVNKKECNKTEKLLHSKGNRQQNGKLIFANNTIYNLYVYYIYVYYKELNFP